MKFLSSFRPASLLGLVLERGQLEGGVVNQANGTFRVSRTFRSALSLDPLTNDPELVGREIRNQLDEAGIRERRCVVCVPLQWALTLQTQIPALAEADVASYLRLEAERGFPYAPDDLSIAISRFRGPNGKEHASLVAIPKSHLVLLDKCLRAAHLKPLSFSLGITVLRELDDVSADTLLTLGVGETGLEIQVAIHGGVAALRTLEGALETEESEKRVDADLVARELRITLGQLPKDLRELVNRIRVFGPKYLTGPLAKEIGPLVKELGLLLDLGLPPRLDGADPEALQHSHRAAAFNLAARCMAGALPPFEFLPPKVSPLAQFTARFSSARVLYASASAAAAALIVGGLFVWQQWELSAREAHWRAMQPKVNLVQTLRQKTGKYRSWFDESVRSLRIFRRLTEAFPEDGSVTAKSLKIKDLTEVSCTGVARDDQAFQSLLDQLNQAKEVQDLQFKNLIGRQPLQFDLTFKWVEGVKRQN